MNRNNSKGVTGLVVFAGLALLLSCDNPIVDVEVENESICFVATDVSLVPFNQVPGAPPLPEVIPPDYLVEDPATMTNIEMNFSLALSELPDTTDDFDLEVRWTRFEMRSDSLDLRGFNRARAIAVDSSSAQLLGNYDPEWVPATASRLRFRTVDEVNLVDLLKEEPLELRVELFGTVPLGTYSVDFEVCAGVKAGAGL